MTRSALAGSVDFGLLRSVASDEDLDAAPAVMELQFEHAFLRLQADPDWDTLEVAVQTESDPSLADVSNHEFWTDVMGTVLTWSWTMINQQGYHDGLQMSFRRPDGSEIIKQVMVWTSAITMARVTDIRD